MSVRQLLTVLCLCICGPALADDMPRVSLETNVGRIVLELDKRRAPTSVQNFVNYVNSGFYNETLFHRVIDGFMIQGGGFSPKLMRKQTQAPIRNEANNGLKNVAYSISMARTNSPHSATSQFFINTVDNPNLDHTAPTGRGWGYAVFGRVIEGFDVVDQIGTTATGSAGPFPRDVPRDPIIIQSALVVVPEVTTDGETSDSSDAAATAADNTTPVISETAAETSTTAQQ